MHRHGVPRGLATAVTALCGFVVLGLVGWFVGWQVLGNLEDLSGRLQDGVDELKRWLLRSPLHITEKQINDLAEKLRDGISSGSDRLTDAGIRGVRVIVEFLCPASRPRPRDRARPPWPSARPRSVPGKHGPTPRCPPGPR